MHCRVKIARLVAGSFSDRLRLEAWRLWIASVVLPRFLAPWRSSPDRPVLWKNERAEKDAGE
jgi:hypothetical protein